jgi:hypothetical protein
MEEMKLKLISMAFLEENAESEGLQRTSNKSWTDLIKTSHGSDIKK